MTFIPLLVFGALAILLVVLLRRRLAASVSNRSAGYDGNTWMPVMWTHANCDSTDAADCGGGDTNCDAGGGSCD